MLCAMFTEERKLLHKVSDAYLHACMLT